MSHFYRISLGGGEATKAFSLPLSVRWMELLSDGRYLLLATVEKDRDNFSLTPQKEQASSPENTWEADCHELEEHPFWMNGEGFISGKRTRLFLYDPTQKEDQRLQALTSPELDLSTAVYAKEEGKIFFSASRAKKVRATFLGLYEYSLTDNTLKKLEIPPLRIGLLEQSSGQLIFTGTDQKHHGLNENPKIYRYSIKEETLEVLLDYDRSIGTMVGTDSSLGGGINFKIFENFLYFTMLTDYSVRICQLSLKTKELSFVSPEGDSFNFFDVSNAGMLAGAFADGKLMELYKKQDNAQSNSWTPLTRFHNVFHETYDYSQPEHHRVNDPDGFEVDGWVLPPTNYKEGNFYPAILHIHGGPKTVLGEVYHHEMQLWANNGYFVLYCNPRGSDGKGNEFSDIRGKYGTVDYENIMLFLDTMLPLYPAIDTQRIGVTGGSYGGFMTNWIIGHTHRFQAAATQRSITNWLSKTYMSDIGYYFNVDQVLAEPWEESSFDAKALWDASPLKYAHNATTPLLVIHSDEDYRCPVPEGYQIFTALQLAGVPTKMCVFHGETHDLSRSGKPKNRLHRLNEILAWMDLYLKK